MMMDYGKKKFLVCLFEKVKEEHPIYIYIYMIEVKENLTRRLEVYKLNI